MKGIVFTFRNKQKTLKLPKISRPAFSIKKAVTKYGFQTVFVILFLLGLAVGAAGSRGVEGDLGQKLDYLFVTNVEARLDMSAFEIFLSCFVSYFLFVLSVFLCALSVWGFSFIPITAMIKGFSVGMSSALIFSYYKTAGIGFYILVVLPGTVLFLFALAWYSKISFGISKRFMKLSLFSNADITALSGDLKRFLKKSAFAFLSAGACAVIDMLLWILFANHFDF